IRGNHGPLSLIGCDFSQLPALSGRILSVTNSPDTPGLMRLTLDSPFSPFLTGDQVNVAGCTGTGALPGATNGTWIITVINYNLSSHTVIDLQGSTFTSGTYNAHSGFCLPTPLNYIRGFNGPITRAYAADIRESYTGSYTIKRAFSGTQYDNNG